MEVKQQRGGAGNGGGYRASEATSWVEEWIDGKLGRNAGNVEREGLIDRWNRLMDYLAEKSWGETARKTIVSLIIGLVLAVLGLIYLAYYYGFLWVVIAGVVIVSALMIYLKIKRSNSSNEDVSNDNELRMLYVLLCRVGAIKQGDFYEDWNAWFQGEEYGQVKYELDCRAQGVDILKLKDKMKLEVSKIAGAYDCIVQKSGASRYTIIFDYNDPHDSGSELYDYFHLHDDLPHWDMPTKLAKNGVEYPTGVIALGAINQGVRFGRIEEALIWQHHFGVSGISGFGKSNMVHFLLCQMAQFSNIQFVYIDPNETDGNLWRDRAAVVAGPDKALSVLNEVMLLMKERAEIMKKQNMANWRATEKNPAVVVIVDEISYLARDKEVLKQLEDLTRIGRKYGIICVMATQYPKKQNVGGVWENLHYKTSSKLNNRTESEVVFGSKAGLAPCEDIEAKGIFYASTPEGKVDRIRVPYIPEDLILSIADETKRYKNQQYVKRFGGGSVNRTVSNNFDGFGL